MIRLFAGIDIPEDIGEALMDAQDGLPGAAWRDQESFHITLRFFGDIREDQAQDVDSALSVVTSPPFALQLQGVGHFGEGERIDNVWAGVADEPLLTQLAGRCEAAARQAGLKPETRAFKPHLTLAYLKRPEPSKVAAWIQANNLLKSPPFAIDRFGLYSSHMTKDSSVYQLERMYRF
jgi:2'-5' RNA ligase